MDDFIMYGGSITHRFLAVNGQKPEYTAKYLASLSQILTSPTKRVK